MLPFVALERGGRHHRADREARLPLEGESATQAQPIAHRILVDHRGPCGGGIALSPGGVAIAPGRATLVLSFLGVLDCRLPSLKSRSAVAMRRFSMRLTWFSFLCTSAGKPPPQSGLAQHCSPCACA